MRKKTYNFWLNMNDSYKYETSIDEWGCASLALLGSDYGCEYNYCIDGDDDLSAIYLYRYNPKYDDYETDTSCYRAYSIEWDKEDWKQRLMVEMTNFLEDNTEWYFV